MDYVVARRQRDTAYKDRALWLPKPLINVPAVVGSLTFDHPDPGRDLRLVLCQEADRHLIVPREYLQYKGVTPEFPVLTLGPEFKDVAFDDKIKIRDEKQEKAWNALNEAEGGVLSLACGGGKTVLSLKKIAARGKPALVIVGTGQLLEQWKERAEEFLGLREKDIGIVQAKKFEWEKPLTIAMIQTLSKHADKWPREFSSYYGTVIWDEVHHLAAPQFSRTADLFWGARYGLSATPTREDGMEGVYYAHIGAPFYVDVEYLLKPKIYFQRLPTHIDMQTTSEIKDRRGEFNISKFWKYLTSLEERNVAIADHIKKAHASGRKVLVLGHSKPGLGCLMEHVPGAGLVTGDILDQKKRLRIFRKYDIVLATMNVAAEALDNPALDTVFFTTPFKSWSLMTQGMGRALREYKDKKDPVVVVFEDMGVGPSRALCNKLRRSLYQGDYEFMNVD